MIASYWVADLAAPIKAAVLADWGDELEDWHLSQIRGCLREWRRENPNKRPNPAHISGMLKRKRGMAEVERRAAMPQPIESRPVISDEDRARRAEILAETTRKLTAKAKTGDNISTTINGDPENSPAGG